MHKGFLLVLEVFFCFVLFCFFSERKSVTLVRTRVCVCVCVFNC